MSISKDTLLEKREQEDLLELNELRKRASENKRSVSDQEIKEQLDEDMETEHR